MSRPPDLVVGKEEHGGLPNPGRPHLQPAPHWRLEAIAAVERPRDLQVTPTGGLVFLYDRDTSDVWHLAAGLTTPTRITTQRDIAPYWEDTAPALSPDGEQVAFADAGFVWLVALDGGAPRRIARAGGPRWLDDDRLLVLVGRAGCTQLAELSESNPWPRVLAGGDGDVVEPTVAPDRRSIAFTFWPHDDRNRSEIRVVDLERGDTRALTGTPRIHDGGPAWSPDGRLIAYQSEQSGWYEIHLVDADGGTARQLTHETANFGSLEWHADGTRLVATRTRRGRTDLVTVDAATGAVTALATGGTWSSPVWMPDGSIAAAFEDYANPPRIEQIDAATGERHVWFDPTPAAVRAAPAVRAEEITYRSFDGTEIHGFLFRPTRTDGPFPAIVYPHGGPTSAYEDDWDGVAQYFVDKGYAWLAINFRGSTGYGRDFERANHGVWGVHDTLDCLAAYDFLASDTTIDARKIAIFGASYGSYLALCALTDDQQHRFAAGVCKYGDCDIVTSWSTSDRDGRQDLERMMGTPADNPAAYRAGSPVHRLGQIERPLLIAHGEQDDRVHPSQSEELVAELRRLGKTYEYVTYPSEGHGFLRRAPFLDFHRRLERFLDWYLHVLTPEQPTA